MPVVRRGDILRLSVTKFFSKSGFLCSIASAAISMRRRGMVRLARRKAERRLAVFGCMRLASLAMKRMLFQKRVVFFLFQPVRRTRTLLVSRRHVTRNRFAQSFSLGAFQCDNFLRH